MKRKFTLFFAFVFNLLTFNALAQEAYNANGESDLYKEALLLFNQPNPSPHTDSLALYKFLRVIKVTRAEQKNAPILSNCYEKAGVIKQTYGFQRQAIELYKKAIACRSAYNLPDSLHFKPYLYCGSACFVLNLFDSSLYYLNKAEAILLKFPAQQGSQRLYNSFGALYYESGNYSQSINYFRKAVQLNLRNNHPEKKGLTYSYKSNIASALRRLGDYSSAVSMYKSLIPLTININEVFINLGAIYLEKNQPDSAFYYLSKVRDAEGNNRVILENTLGNVYLQKNQLKEASSHLNRALSFYKKDQQQNNSPRKNKYVGITYKLLADIAYRQNNIVTALGYYHQSIIQLDYAFNDSVIYHNPSTAAGGFRNYALFESLAAKATCMRKLYAVKPTDQHREITINTYQASLRLADYIEKSFDMEDAQLFIVQKIFPVYQEAVTFMIHSFEETKKETYLEEAFRLAEKSKAISLHINLKENEIKLSANIPDSLLKKERDLKFNLSRLLIKIEKSVTHQQLSTLTAEMEENELALSRLANKLLDYPDYRRKKFSFDRIDVPYLRKNLLRQNRAILSYFQTGETVYCFVLTQDGIHYYTAPRDRAYRMALRTLNAQLRNLTPGLPYQGYDNARFLYNRLVGPAERELRTVSSLIIIPHNELSLLPFDILTDNNKTYLLEKFDITYQYAASFLQDEEKGKINLKRMLAMAPFDLIGKANNPEFAFLPASDAEISDLDGIKLKSEEATKANFLKYASRSSAIHLATHAVPDNNNPSQSYIAFYADTKDESKLYAHELRNETLSGVHLIFLSACETATGKLISGEGVMSLSRAFSAAGCSNVVTSLWRAEDNATAFISSRFYTYVKQGNNFPEALRKAKLSLLHDGRYAQFHAPQYWSHLVFVGIPDETMAIPTYWFWIGYTLVISFIGISWWRYKSGQ
ncbi:CHAT domain-containing protein [Spirosoma spitsbergense]|uniref:CHAT domain-containing protein n=1 Tax=Spirosoma spitsbergense TaxID=431554 RepID=UPI00036D66F1|nr:CHAT domain-containing protein [Spirosoma spitsbergense]